MERRLIEAAPAVQHRSAAPGVSLIGAFFFLSGSAGLVYQVLWMRSLGLFFGSDMYGVSIILSAFMGGLALGSLAGGRLAERTARPLLWYGAAELGIGGFALVFFALLGSLDPLLQAAYPRDGGAAAPLGYQLARGLLATGALLVPTTLMGATLPLVLKHFVHSRTVLGELAGHFYSLNTLGALAGTLTGGFVLLPYLGMTRSTACAAAINLAIGAACVAVGARSALRAPAQRAAEELDPLPGLEARVRRRVARAALVAIGVSGFCSFALEVVWTRILLMSFSATVYSFASMLACFLFGIFLGSRGAARVVDRHANPVGLFAALELGVGASVAALCLLLYGVPDLFGRLLVGVASLLGEARGHALVVATLLASFLLLVVPATLLGATFPVALRIYTTSVARVGTRTGELYASNTLGAILGSLTAGLVLVPALGATTSLAAIAVAFGAVGASLAAVGVRSGERSLAPRPVAIAAAATLSCVISALLLPYRVTLNFNQKTLAGAELLYHAEGIQNTIDVVRSQAGTTALVIGGNVEADDSYRQRRHFVLKGHLPLLLLERPRRVLVIGLGMGITLQATARHPGLERIDVVELSPEILGAQAQLAGINGDVARNPLVRVRIDDGRLFLKLTHERYDMITADPIHPKISRVGYLYTREYYGAIREHLGPGGAVCQWMPTYQISPRRFRSAVRTFLEVFPDAMLWYVEGHALLVAKPGAPVLDYALLERKFAHPAVREDLASIDIHSPAELLGHLLMGPQELAAFAGEEPEAPTNTDDYPYLEYFVPGDLFYTTRDNASRFASHLADPRGLVRNLPPRAEAALAAQLEQRRRRLPDRP